MIKLTKISNKQLTSKGECIIEDFGFHSPTKVLFGKGVEARMGAEVTSRGLHRVLVRFGGTYLAETGVLDRIRQSLTDAGLSYLDLGGVIPNPRLFHAEEGVTLCKKEGVDFILGVGGDNAIDSTEAITYGLASEFDLEGLFLGKVKTDEITPIGYVTTITTTGSETSNSTMITIETKEQGILKRSYNHDYARPLFTVMNPELTRTLPIYQTSSGAADIMIHTMRHYITQAKNVELSDHTSERLLITVRDAAFKVLKNPQDYEARVNLMWADSLFHGGLTGTGQINGFLVHKLRHEPSAMFDAIHGANLTATWGSRARTVYKGNPARFVGFTVKVFGVEFNYGDSEEAALAGIDAQDDWCVKIGMPIAIADLLGFTPMEAQIDEMVEKTATTGRGVTGLFHRLDKQDLIAIYKKAL